MRHQGCPPLPVLVLTGPPGAGKTTAARVLAERFERAVHLESERFFDFIGELATARRDQRPAARPDAKAGLALDNRRAACAP
jgi:replication-associated recombination protein RarA